MKLHLPVYLRSLVSGGFSVISGISTTVGLIVMMSSVAHGDMARFDFKAGSDSDEKEINLPDSAGFTWVPGSVAPDISTADITDLSVRTWAAHISGETGWFGGTGQSHADNSEISMSSDSSFTFTSRPRYANEYVAVGVSLPERADGITLRFDTDNTVGYSLWAWDGSSATNLAAYATSGAADGVTATYSGDVVDTDATIYAIWHTGNNVAGGTVIAVDNIILTYQAAPPVPYYWEASGGGNWADANWSTTDGDFTTPVFPPAGIPIEAVFNNDETAAVNIGDGALATTLTVAAGAYTFSGNAGAMLTISGELSVSGDAVADIQTGVKTGSISISDSGALSLTGSIETGSIAVGTGCSLHLSDTTLDANGFTISNNGAIQLSGEINLLNYSGVTGESVAPASGTGWGDMTTSYIIFAAGTSSAASGTEWLIDGVAVSGSTVFTNGVLAVTTNSSTIYYVGSGSTIVYDGGAGGSPLTGATGIALNGGILQLETALSIAGFISSQTNTASTINLNGMELAQSALGTISGSVELSSGTGAADSVYNLGNETALKTNVSLADDWAGKVKVGNVSDVTLEFDVSSFGKPGSQIEMGVVNVKWLSSMSGATVTAQALSLAESSAVNGNLTVGEPLTLGNNDSAAVLTVEGALRTDRIVLGNAQSATVADSLLTSGDFITIGITDISVLAALNEAASKSVVTLISLTEAYAGAGAVLDTTVSAQRTNNAAIPIKYETILEWNSTKTELIYRSRANEHYVYDVTSPHSPNAEAGASLLQQGFMQLNPQVSAPGSGLAQAMDAVDAGTMSQDALAAVAGASSAAMSMAFHSSVGRRLQAIRNRTTTMGVNQSMVQENMPYFNAWINAECDRDELSQNGTESGYVLNSRGGTVGFDADFCPTLTAGVAFTAVYGDVDYSGVDNAGGDMDTYYLSVFVRYAASAWTHTIVGTIGKSEISTKRTLSGASLKSDTDGMGFGLMYEVGRVFTLNEDGSTCLQPVFNIIWRHTTVDSYTEKGSNLALKVDAQALDTVTFGLGVRMQTEMGENIYNRTGILEARVLVKADAGERRGSADVALAALNDNEQSVESAETGIFGLEAGAGITVPLGSDGGSLFLDAAVELRSDYTNLNATFGYRLNF